MTRDEINARVKVNLGGNSIYFTDALINPAIQDSYGEVAALAGTILKATVVPFSAHISYYDFGSLISDFGSLISVWNSAVRRWMIPVAIKELDKESVNWETALGTPEYISPLNHRYVAIYRKPGAAGYGSMYVFYRARADTLAGGDTPSIPIEYQGIIEDLTTLSMFEKIEEWAKAQKLFASYIDDLNKLRIQAEHYKVPDRLRVMGAY